MATRLVKRFAPITIIPKNLSKLHRFIGKVLFFNKDYMKRFWTTIGFTVAVDKDGTIFCDTNRESLLESIDGAKDMEVKDYKAIFRRPSFGDSVGLYGSIFSLGDSGVNFNPLLARYNKIKALIKSWDLKEGTPTEEDIKSLHPIIATAIGIQLDLETGSIFG